MGKVDLSTISSEIMVFSSKGANSYGQLGSGHREDTMIPTPSSLPSTVARRLCQIMGGGGHTVLLTGLHQFD